MFTFIQERFYSVGGDLRLHTVLNALLEMSVMETGYLLSDVNKWVKRSFNYLFSYYNSLSYSALFLFINCSAEGYCCARSHSVTHTHTHTTLGRIPLGEWSPLRSDLYLQTHTHTHTHTHTTLTRHRHPYLLRDSNSQFQQASGRKLRVLDRTATGIGRIIAYS